MDHWQPACPGPRRGASPAPASSSGGALVFDSNECQPFGPGITLCLADRVVHQEASTPSGNISYSDHDSYQMTVTFPDGSSFTIAGANRDHVLLKQGDVQEHSVHESSTLTQVDCAIARNIHHANGTMQFDNVGCNCASTGPGAR